MSWTVRSQHTGADFEGGRLGHRNGEQLPGDNRVFNAREDDNSALRTGIELSTPRTTSVKRKPAVTLPVRMGAVWATVDVVGKERETNPEVVCRDCSSSFRGGATRLTEHIIARCSCSTSELQTLKAKLILEAEAKERNAKQKAAEAAVDEAASKKVKSEGALSLQQVHPSLPASACASQCTRSAMHDACVWSSVPHCAVHVWSSHQSVVR
jgi:hypothetical protein